MTAFSSVDDALAELVCSEERYVKTLHTFRTVSTSDSLVDRWWSIDLIHEDGPRTISPGQTKKWPVV